MVKWRNSNINFFVHKHFLPKKLHSDVTIDLQGSQTSCDITILSIDTVHGGSRREQSLCTVCDHMGYDTRNSSAMHPS